MNTNNSNNIAAIESPMDAIPMEVLARILQFTITDDKKMLENVKRTCPKWDKMTENVCFWRPIFGKPDFLQFGLIVNSE